MKASLGLRPLHGRDHCAPLNGNVAEITCNGWLGSPPTLTLVKEGSYFKEVPAPAAEGVGPVDGLAVRAGAVKVGAGHRHGRVSRPSRTACHV